MLKNLYILFIFVLFFENWNFKKTKNGVFAIAPNESSILMFMKNLSLNKVTGIGKVMQSYVSFEN